VTKGDSRKTKRAQAARERAREAHAKLVVQRHGDPRYVQQTHTATGRTIHLRPEDVAMLREQHDAFVAKFGREPGPDDPLFFDATKDVPTPFDEEAGFAEIREAVLAAGVDPAYIDAWHEVGYLITEDNQHLFSAHEVEAYFDAVERARAHAAEARDEEPGDDDDVSVVNLTEERVAAARAGVLDRLMLDEMHAIAAAREALGRQLGTVINMTTEAGQTMADVDIVCVGVYEPDDAEPPNQHIEDVALALREESLNWLEGKRLDYVDSERMPKLADFVALSDDEQLMAWVAAQMTIPPTEDP
jgi:hypothetical protein